MQKENKGKQAQKRAHEAFIDKLENIDLEEIENNPEEYLQKLLEFLLGWLINIPYPNLKRR